LSVADQGSHEIVPIIGKFGHSSKYRETLQIAQQLWKEGFSPPNSLRICQPIAYLEEWQLLLVYYAYGISLDALIIAHHDATSSCVANAARWLAKLHETKIVLSNKRSVDDEVGKMKGTSEKLAAKFPTLGQMGDRAVDGILRRLKLVESRSFRPTHGDYLPKNILSDGPNVTVIDLGRMSYFDPAKDIGKFIGNMTVESWKFGTNLDTAKMRMSS
jgi:Phosphotransferase enzyme family